MKGLVNFMGVEEIDLAFYCSSCQRFIHCSCHRW